MMLASLSSCGSTTAPAAAATSRGDSWDWPSREQQARTNSARASCLFGGWEMVCIGMM